MSKIFPLLLINLSLVLSYHFVIHQIGPKVANSIAAMGHRKNIKFILTVILEILILFSFIAVMVYFAFGCDISFFSSFETVYKIRNCEELNLLEKRIIAITSILVFLTSIVIKQKLGAFFGD